jgi:flagellar hook assembly protein FlgD
VQANSDSEAPSYLAVALLCVVVAAALTSLALIQEARQRGEVLDLVEATNSIVPEAGQRARIEWRQRRSSDDADVLIIDTAGRPVRTLLDGGGLAGDDREQVFHWNGRTDAGDLAPPGLYRVEIVLEDQDREIVPEQSAIRVRGASRLEGGD